MSLFNIGAILKLVSDATKDLPDIEKGVSVIKTVLVDLAAGKMPALTPEDEAIATKLVGDVEQLITDVKAL